MAGSTGRVVRSVLAGFCVGFCALWPCVVLAQDEDKPPRDFSPPPPPAAPLRPQELNLGYSFNVSHPGHIDRENIAAFSMASMDAIHLALQDAADDPFYLRLPKWGAAFAIDSAIRYVGHEYGHLSTF